MNLQASGSAAYARSAAVVMVLAIAAGFLHANLRRVKAQQPNACKSCRPLKPADDARCKQLEAQLSKPAQFVYRGQAQLDKYEPIMAEFMEKLCYRAWPHDSSARDTGPYTATLAGGVLKAQAYNQHAVSRVWYSPAMFAWMEKNRPEDETKATADPPAIPIGAMMVKEMWTPPLERWPGMCWDCVKPDASGAVFWIRDDQTFSTGWFGSWYGPSWSPAWPAAASNPLTGSGEGASQFCSNCHAATVSGNTFVSMRNYEGKNVHRFLTQLVPNIPAATPHHELVALPPNRVARLGEALYDYDQSFSETFKAKLAAPDWTSVDRMPSQTYDDVLVGGKQKVMLGKDPVYFQTSTQCLGCHTPFATGLQYDMASPVPASEQGKLGGSLFDHSPYGLWAASPMGLAGRDPIFFAQLESEQKFHPAQAKLIQDTCLQCHGIMGQRQYALDSETNGNCGQFQRSIANAIPYPSGNPTALNASYGALSRDGISCTTCHHVVLGADADEYRNLPANRCVAQKQTSFNPPATHSGFALTFTGNFFVGPPNELYGPFENPKSKLMENSLDIKPIHNSTTLMSSEMCGSCHTIHLPRIDDPQPGLVGSTADPFKPYPKVYEQASYPEWVFSAYRTGASDGKPLPLGPGKLAKSCQGCHTPDHDAKGKAYSSKIATVEEFSNYPETDYRLPAADIDLAPRTPYGRHELVGLNIFLLKMFQQFPDVLGVRINNPSGLPGSVAPLVTSAQLMLDQAQNATAKIDVTPSWDAAKKTLTAQVKVENKTGHKFPSGVSFRRAFIQLEVLDQNGNTLWSSGRTNDAGVIVDEKNQPIAGEHWWKPDCSARIPANEQRWQPHYQTITRQDQAQIYQDLSKDKHGFLTTSFLSIDDEVKDNRLLPHGFLPLADRLKIARALGDTTPLDSHMDENLATAVESKGVEGDKDYEEGNGLDNLTYVIGGLSDNPATVRVTLYYQSTAPNFLQDRFCVAPDGADTQRLYFLAGHLNLDGTEADGWKLRIVQSYVWCSKDGGPFRCS